MKRLLVSAAIVLLAGTPTAFAQGPAANPNASTPAIASPSHDNPGAPAAGANSFTKEQAKARIEAAGFTHVSGLVKDKDGIWRGKATKGTQTVDVSLDFQGNVVTQ